MSIVVDGLILGLLLFAVFLPRNNMDHDLSWQQLHVLVYVVKRFLVKEKKK